MTHLEIQALIAIRRGTAHSRADLARRLNVSRPTASTVVSGLLSRGLIEETGRGVSSGGKAPTLLAVCGGGTYFIGVDLGYSDRISAVLTDLRGRILRRTEQRFIPSTPMETTEKVAELASELTSELPDGTVLHGAAVALSGIVEWNTGRVLRSINPAFVGDSLRRELEVRLNLPVLVENRARMAAVSEAFGGIAEGEENFALISLGKSIGSAFHLNRELYAGHHSMSGELRQLRLSNGMTMEEAMSPAEVGAADPEKTLQRCAEGLGQFLSILDLDLLVLSGRFADFGASFPVRLEEELKKNDFDCRIRAARFGRFSAARGSAFRLGELQIIKNKM